MSERKTFGVESLIFEEAVYRVFLLKFLASCRAGRPTLREGEFLEAIASLGAEALKDVLGATATIFHPI